MPSHAKRTPLNFLMLDKSSGSLSCERNIAHIFAKTAFSEAGGRGFIKSKRAKLTSFFFKRDESRPLESNTLGVKFVEYLEVVTPAYLLRRAVAHAASVK